MKNSRIRNRKERTCPNSLKQFPGLDLITLEARVEPVIAETDLESQVVKLYIFANDS